jgi:hypothetical protein
MMRRLSLRRSMPKQHKIYRAGAVLAIIAMAALLLGAVVFWKERMLFSDASYISSQIINTQQLQIQQWRYGAFITQLFPLLASKMHLSLQALLVLYSASFNIFYLAIAGLLVFYFKEYRLAILMGFYYTLMSSDSFYWCNNEVYQGIAWMFLFYTSFLKWGRQERRPVAMLVWWLLLAGIALITHPLVIIPFVYLYVFLWVYREDWPFSNKQSFWLGALLGCLVLGKLVLSKRFSSYDTGMIPYVRDINPVKALASDMAADILQQALVNYWFVPILMVWGIASAIKEKRFLLAALSGGGSLMYFLLICITFKHYEAFYTESELMPLIIIATTPFIYISLPKLRYNMEIALLVMIFLIRFVYIGYSSQVFSSRLAVLERILTKMEQQGISKLVLVKQGEAIDQRLMLDWGTPIESLHLSALKGDQPQKSFAVVQADKLSELTAADHKTFIASFGTMPSGKLNSHYYLVDTVQAYHIADLNIFMPAE